MISNRFIAGITNKIGVFTYMMTDGMNKSVRKNFREYLLEMMIPPETKRKSIARIFSPVSESDQKAINRAFHSSDIQKLEPNYIKF